MKLELKHIKGYLDTELNVMDEETGEQFQVAGFNVSNNEFLIHDNIDGSIEDYSVNLLKPILRPLSDLTKEIEANGEKFVPIERLLDIETKHNWSSSDYLESVSGQNEWWVKLKGKDSSYIFGYNSIMGFYMMNQFSEKQFVKNQIELFQKLLEWHFDIHGLI